MLSSLLTCYAAEEGDCAHLTRSKGAERAAWRWARDQVHHRDLWRVQVSMLDTSGTMPALHTGTTSGLHAGLGRRSCATRCA